MRIRIFEIAAFADEKRMFTGNPAAVCPLDEWLDDCLLQSIAAENNLSETAFFAPCGDAYALRWFTPTKEIELCGHATLASAFVIFSYLNHKDCEIVFNTKSCDLRVTQKDELISMTFPLKIPTVCDCPIYLADALGKKPLEVLKSDDYIAVYKEETDILQINPDLELLKTLDLRGVTITAEAAAKTFDYALRFFAPNYGINEDPVTGSALCYLTPYWASRLGRRKFKVRQLSKRTGVLYSEIASEEESVIISGSALLYLEGYIHI
ncbi:isomerase [Candidatus Magnetoovum chiemensis]|nr:isomerase [Candidatus Magnetoovum chiemensis]